MIRAWDTLPAHDERIPSGMYLAADCSLDIGAVRSSFWQELRDGLKCWEGGPLPDDVVVISATTYPPRLRPPDDDVLVISSGPVEAAVEDRLGAGLDGLRLKGGAAMVVQAAILIRRWRWVGENGEGGRTWTRAAAMRAYERSTSAD